MRKQEMSLFWRKKSKKSVSRTRRLAKQSKLFDSGFFLLPCFIRPIPESLLHLPFFRFSSFFPSPSLSYSLSFSFSSAVLFVHKYLQLFHWILSLPGSWYFPLCCRDPLIRSLHLPFGNGSTKARKRQTEERTEREGERERERWGRKKHERKGGSANLRGHRNQPAPRVSRVGKSMRLSPEGGFPCGKSGETSIYQQKQEEEAGEWEKRELSCGLSTVWQPSPRYRFLHVFSSSKISLGPLEFPDDFLPRRKTQFSHGL